MRCLPVFSGAVIAVFLFVFTSLAADKEMSVQTREARLKSEPTPFSTVVGKANLADRVTVMEEKGIWSKVRVQSSGKTGWLPTRSLTKKKLQLEAASVEKTSASSGEMALATKGFTPEVEKAFKKQNSKISFEWVDKMESVSFPFDEKKAFLEKGKVLPKEGKQ